ncbi:XisI protein [Synechocystis sp. FACHB-383]|uniref:XisI protein n=1 Tax=Synechocystis sp. FACHB-383 TaxID=2692864 RepID=UPI0016866729|nr:XisI protein [Synechocystis sp. FACHB-383]MBD2653638.1 XisI protein [Synechocystis sp. FACHB-383]
MDKLVLYRQSIQQLLSGYVGDEKQNTYYECQLIFDEKNDHYLWLDLGWNGSQRIYFTIIHFDIKDGKIWLQHNATDLNPAEDLVAMGVERQNIVLGLQAPHKRPYTDYGVA